MESKILKLDSNLVFRENEEFQFNSIQFKHLEDNDILELLALVLILSNSIHKK